MPGTGQSWEGLHRTLSYCSAPTVSRPSVWYQLDAEQTSCRMTGFDNEPRTGLGLYTFNKDAPSISPPALLCFSLSPYLMWKQWDMCVLLYTHIQTHVFSLHTLMSLSPLYFCHLVEGCVLLDCLQATSQVRSSFVELTVQ